MVTTDTAGNLGWAAIPVGGGGDCGNNNGDSVGNVTGADAIACGSGAVTNGAQAAAWGAGANATGVSATASGHNAQALGDNAAAFGAGATASAANAMVLGAGANTAGYSGSSAIGAGAVNTAANQMMLGTAANTYVAPGVTSAASAAAQLGTTKFVSSDSAGRLATSQYGPGDIVNINNNINSLSANVAVGFSNAYQQIDANRRRADQGIALTASLPTTHMPTRPGKTTLSMSSATYKGQAGIGVAMMHRLDVANPTALGGSVAIGVRNSVLVKGELVTEF
jgi:autotransporter adhesin